MHNQVDIIKAEYKEKESYIEWKYKNRIKSLEKENIYLHKVVDKFKETIEIKTNHIRIKQFTYQNVKMLYFFVKLW